jgi:hypothetical protein
MGAPALAPATEVAAQEAAKQTTRLVVIEGGKAAAKQTAARAGAAEVAGLAARGAAGATLAAIGAFLLILLYPSKLADGTLPKNAPKTFPDTPPEPVQLCPLQQAALEQALPPDEPSPFLPAVPVKARIPGFYTDQTCTDEVRTKLHDEIERKKRAFEKIGIKLPKRPPKDPKDKLRICTTLRKRIQAFKEILAARVKLHEECFAAMGPRTQDEARRQEDHDRVYEQLYQGYLKRLGEWKKMGCDDA